MSATRDNQKPKSGQLNLSRRVSGSSLSLGLDACETLVKVLYLGGRETREFSRTLD